MQGYKASSNFYLLEYLFNLLILALLVFHKKLPKELRRLKGTEPAVFQKDHTVQAFSFLISYLYLYMYACAHTCTNLFFSCACTNLVFSSWLFVQTAGG